MADDRDWKEIEIDYRGAVMPISTICRVHGVSRSLLMDHAARNGWTRDLISQVRMEVNERLYTQELSRPVPENDVVAKAAEVMVAVVRSHRKDIAKLRGVASQAMDHFALLMAEGVFEEYTDEDGNTKVRLNKSALVLGKTQGVATALDNLASAYARIIDMERKAFGFDTGGSASVGISMGGDPNSVPQAQVTFYMPDNGRDPPTPE